MILLLLLFIFLILKGNKITIHELGLGDKENWESTWVKLYNNLLSFQVLQTLLRKSRFKS